MDRVIGEQPTGRDQQFHATFRVPYEPGTLSVQGLDVAGKVQSTFEMRTANDAAKIRLKTDRAELIADGQDLAFVKVEIADANNVVRKDAATPVRYFLDGPGEIAGVGSGDLTSTEPYNARTRNTYQGRALVVIRTTNDPGDLKLTATAEGLEPATIAITTTAPTPTPPTPRN
jgi:beta-galactosidase